MEPNMFDRVFDVICKGENISIDTVKMKDRGTEIVYPRQLIMYFAHELKLGSLSQIAKKFKKDHATTSHAIKVINNYITTDKVKREQIQKYKEELFGINGIVIKSSALKQELQMLSNNISDMQNKMLTLQLSLRDIESDFNKLKL